MAKTSVIFIETSELPMLLNIQNQGAAYQTVNCFAFNMRKKAIKSEEVIIPPGTSCLSGFPHGTRYVLIQVSPKKFVLYTHDKTQFTLQEDSEESLALKEELIALLGG